MRYINDVERTDLVVAGVRVDRIEVRPSGEPLRAEAATLYERLTAGEVGVTEELKTAVRAVLRNGKYKPSGRGKPASEYLMGLWRKQGALDLINNVVDVNNIVSLGTGLPISVFDGGKLQGDALAIRLGEVGASYVFNASGQELACQDLVVVCDGRGPIGSPVKDSQATKLFEGATSALFVVYANARSTSAQELLTVAGRLGELLSSDCEGSVATEPFLFERPA